MCAAVIRHSAVFVLDVGASECAVLGDAAFHARAPQPKRVGLQLVAHQSDDFRFRPARALLNGFKAGAIFPSHLDDGRNVAFGKAGKTLRKLRPQGDAPRWTDFFQRTGCINCP